MSTSNGILEIHKYIPRKDNPYLYCIILKGTESSTYASLSLKDCIEEYVLCGTTRLNRIETRGKRLILLEMKITPNMDLYQEVIKYIPEELI